VLFALVFGSFGWRMMHLAQFCLQVWVVVNALCQGLLSVSQCKNMVIWSLGLWMMHFTQFWYVWPRIFLFPVQEHGNRISSTSVLELGRSHMWYHSIRFLTWWLFCLWYLAHFVLWPLVNIVRLRFEVSWMFKSVAKIHAWLLVMFVTLLQ
jgi:hypothetical protein